MFDEYLRYLAVIHLNEPRSPDPDSQYSKSLDRLVEACEKAGVNYQQVMDEVLNEMQETKP